MLHIKLIKGKLDVRAAFSYYSACAKLLASHKDIFHPVDTFRFNKLVNLKDLVLLDVIMSVTIKSLIGTAIGFYPVCTPSGSDCKIKLAHASAK